jgi:L-threonylcarbamoyladenylate synthase
MKAMATQDEIRKAAEIIRSGGLVVFPTETVYGLGANALDATAVSRIYTLKGRPATSPLIVHVASIELARELAAEWLPEAEELARAYWPGPLTIVVPKQTVIPDEVTAGLSTVGLRMPRHPVALELLNLAAVPIAAPSANRFTQLSPTTAQHVRDAFGVETPFLLDGGSCEVGVESTVVAVTQDGLEVLRPGMAMVENTTEAPEIDEGAHRSPGQHKKHYSPRTRVLLVANGKLPEHGRGAYLWIEHETNAARAIRMPGQAAAYAGQLYSRLHELDSAGFDWIAVELPPQTREWLAVRDRLTRAAY